MISSRHVYYDCLFEVNKSLDSKRQMMRFRGSTRFSPGPNAFAATIGVLLLMFGCRGTSDQQNAAQEITVAAAQARRGLRHFAADLAIEQAAKQLVLTPETDRALISEFVREATTGVNGGHK